ncbi:MAG TPA: PorP/SprF family type IX secretion system membrane protein [Chryseosolibacter sp.]
MKNRSLFSAALLSILFVGANAQSITSSTPVRNYYYDFKLFNPAFTGTEAQHSITTGYSEDQSGLFGAPRLGYGSYELNLPSIESGVGFISSIQEIGIVRFTHYGLLYSKKLSVTEKSGFHFGTQLAHQRERRDYTKLRLIDPTDPVVNSGIETITNFNLSFGVAYYSPTVTVGAGFKNIFKEEFDTREYNLVVTRSITITDKIEATPSLFFIMDEARNSVRLNTSFKLFDWVLLGAGYTFPQNGSDNLDVNIGLNIKDRVQIITHVYAAEYARHRSNNRETTWIESMIRVRIGEPTANEH